MEEITQYAIVSETAIERLTDGVNAAILLGWKPQGGITTGLIQVTDSHGQPVATTFYYQAIVR